MHKAIGFPCGKRFHLTTSSWNAESEQVDFAKLCKHQKSFCCLRRFIKFTIPDSSQVYKRYIDIEKLIFAFFSRHISTYQPLFRIRQNRVKSVDEIHKPFFSGKISTIVPTAFSPVENTTTQTALPSIAMIWQAVYQIQSPYAWIAFLW